jgi:tetratricopeptide (TPR) repeat protein
VIGTLAFPTVASAQCGTSIGRIVNVTREVTMAVTRGAKVTPAAVNAPICVGGLIRTGDRSRATISLNNNTQLVIDQNTEWEVVSPSPANSQIRVVRGAILVITRQRGLRIETPFVNAGVEGTEFLVNVEANRTYITVFEGEVQAFSVVQPNLQPLAVRSGQTAIAEQGQNPRILDVAPPDAVRWRLYYQPIIQPLLIAQLAPGGAPPTLETLAAAPAASRDGRSYAQEAALRLDAGDVDGAETAVKAALARDPTLADAYAIRIVSAVIRNDRDTAIETGRTAVKGQSSIPVRLAYSYALQANSDLEGARGALTDIPENARTGAVWIRLSELALAMGDVGDARTAAERAYERETDRVETLAARGFVALAETDLDLARQLFEDAVSRGPGYAQSHLGLGLAKIRSGDLDGGRSDLEVATGLNPSDSIIRSYLGKAYFDERRETQSARQFEVAAEKDPNDPTPLFYAAIQKQSTNRPVEALADLQKAIELNAARSVYRSQVLLDEDLAARSAALGHVYRDLGFEQRALFEGWRALGADPGDYSGHRFLADMYSALPRHEVARVSELLQAQLLQPLSATHVSPSLAETDLALLETIGPSTPSLNDFNPLFRRNRLGAQFTGLVGGHDLLADEAIVSGLWNRVAFSVGQFHYRTDGVRQNNDQTRDLANLFVQAQVSPRTMVQGEMRTEYSRTGDLTVRFDPTFFEPNLRNRSSGTTTRVGVRHDFGQRSQLIASVAVQSRDLDTHVSGVNPLAGLVTTVDIQKDTSGVAAEARHLHRGNRLTVEYGGGFFRAERTRSEKVQFGFLLPGIQGFGNESTFDDKPRQANGYAYAHHAVSSHVTLTLGASVDHFESTLFERNQFNPKIGVAFTPTSSTTLRMAAFRGLTRALVASQTIEPTQVAGFNQFFADEEGAASWRFGAAVDHRVGAAVFAGAEYSWRNLTIPVETIDPLGNRDVNRGPRAEQLGRAYLYLAPHRRVTGSIEYLLERDAARPTTTRAEGNVLSLRSHRLPLTVNVFESRIFGYLRADFVRQNARYFDAFTESVGSDTFWIVGGRVGYRLPARYGRLVLDIANAFDEREFRYEATDPQKPDLTRGRVVTFRFELGV